MPHQPITTAAALGVDPDVTVTATRQPDDTVDVHRIDCPDVPALAGEPESRYHVTDVTSEADVLVVVWETHAAEQRWDDLAVGRKATRFHPCVGLPAGDDHDVYRFGNHGAHRVSE